jgi:secreted PhoX family phosphatase
MTDPFAVDPSRRSFLKSSAALPAALVGGATLELLSSHAAWAQDARGAAKGRAGSEAGGYRALRSVSDASGRTILALPRGFDLVTFGVLGENLIGAKGTHARNADGMGAFAGPGGTVRLIRNQELRNAPDDFTHGVIGEERTRYDPKGMGGTTTLDYDPVARRVVREFFSLNGTIVNCSGGLAYRNAGWLTCEESTRGPREGWGRRHGYTFFVPASGERAEPARPIVPMGRFSKEAAVADAASGIVYQTEDAGSTSGFYRYLPKDPANLMAGGALQMLKVSGKNQFDARERQSVGVDHRVEWVTIRDPDPDLEGGAPSCFAQGHAQGAAFFYRLEGLFRAQNGAMLFVSTTGGDVKSGEPDRSGFRTGYGQLWQYAPIGDDRGVLTLIYESTTGALLDSPDNLVVTPRGGILFCEDDATPDRDVHALAPELPETNRLIGLSRRGQPFTFAVNLLNNTEFAGACFSPDGGTLFVNLFGDGTHASGMTCAITGPWREGAL